MAVGSPVSGSKTIAVRPLRDGNGSCKSGPVTHKYGYSAQPLAERPLTVCAAMTAHLKIWHVQEHQSLVCFQGGISMLSQENLNVKNDVNF